ncbi:hypothetical protein DSCO28_07580 [Desulfosarcina ovata subsp. sediminis]|uniref:Uncharacterized protein n=1 Tax=Desulfosarcina ovata subsp. sediminis TaxID=885957 RepID=A0A5K7ZDV8_9BACT|nr:hypothetical protein DSCO28_07580 [Desulfosarcina ovata subsp. sediminis]
MIAGMARSYGKDEIMDASELYIIRMALLKHDGRSLCPDWDEFKQLQLTGALDRLRLELLTRYEGCEVSRGMVG